MVSGTIMGPYSCNFTETKKTKKKQETSALIWTLINDYICEYCELPVQRNNIAAVPLNVKNMLPISHNS